MLEYGLCNHSIVALRKEASDKSELISQILYGECFKILNYQNKWSFVSLHYDGYEGWVDNKQFYKIEKKYFKKVSTENEILSTNLVDYLSDENKNLQPIVLGSVLNSLNYLKHKFDKSQISISKKNIIRTALLYLNTPYLWGGKTPFGIDCSGLTQMVYRLNGIKIKRDAFQQANQGKILNVFNDIKPGNLAFFSNKEGEISHVGILINNNSIIHAHGKVRVDKFDKNGIYNSKLENYSHKLKFIKSF